jgi:hypothetical protein
MADTTYFSSVDWELYHLVFFGNRQWNVRQKNWPSVVSLFLGNLMVWDVWSGRKPALEMKARAIDEMEKRNEGGE